MTHGYLEKMLDMLTNAYNRSDLINLQKGRPLETNIGKLFSLFAYCLEIIHDNADLVKSWDDLDNAEGSVLDRYGETYGVERGAASDALYRIFIKVKWMAQLSGGDRNTIITAAAELLGVEYSDIEYQDLYPAKIALYVDETLLSEERLALIEQIAYAIKRILVAGVGMRLYIRTYRTYRYDLFIGHGMAIGTMLWPLPISQDRTSRADVEISRGAMIGKRFGYGPSDKGKTFRDQFAVSHGGIVGKRFSYGLIEDDGRVFRGRFSVARGAVASQTMEGVPPDAEPITVTTQQLGVRGAAYRTHLKPKRID